MKKFVEESGLVLVLGIVFALLLAGTQTTLMARIRENQQKALNEAIAEVVPNTVKTEQLEIEGIEGNVVYKCFDADQKVIGWAVQAAGTGFVDKISLVVGLTPQAETMNAIKVIENLETPGLGNKIVGPWADQYQNLSAKQEIVLKKSGADKDKNEIDAITGATWSSRYVTDIVNNAVKRVAPKLEGHR